MPPWRSGPRLRGSGDRYLQGVARWLADCHAARGHRKDDAPFHEVLAAPDAIGRGRDGRRTCFGAKN